jgi:hypothetical protein
MDPIASRMASRDRQRWERLRDEGFGLLSDAHAIYMQYALDKNLGEEKEDERDGSEDQGGGAGSGAGSH